jgi:hypothetical protein
MTYEPMEVVAVDVQDHARRIGIDGLIQVDIGGHPPFPTGSKQFSGNFGNLLFLAVLTSRAILRA